MAICSPVSVVIVAYNSGEALLQAIDSAQRAGAAELIVVDNASSDDAVVRAQARWPQLLTRRQPRNTGFAVACNVGLSLAQQPFILFLNDDATLSAAYLSTLCASLQHDARAAGAIGKLLQRDEPAPRIDSAGICLRPWSWSACDRGAGQIDVGQFDAPAVVFGITGAAPLYRRSILLQHGGYDEQLVSYYEDVDLAWRLNKAGFHHLYVPAALAWHARRGLRGKQRNIQKRAHLNRYRVWFRHERFASLVGHLPVSIPRELLRGARLAAREPRMTWEIYAALPATLRAAYLERFKSRVSPSEFDTLTRPVDEEINERSGRRRGNKSADQS